MGDPRMHINFHEDIIVGMTPRGPATVEVLGLDRSNHSQRQRHMFEIWRCREYIVNCHLMADEVAIGIAATARKFLEASVKSSAFFSAMPSIFCETIHFRPEFRYFLGFI